MLEIGCGPDGDHAMVDLGGVKKEISLALLDNVQVGDYVILHVGYALSRLDPEEAERTLALFSEMAESTPGARATERAAQVKGGARRAGDTQQNALPPGLQEAP